MTKPTITQADRELAYAVGRNKPWNSWHLIAAHREAAVAELRAENERLREALGKIESHETKCVMPWTHEIAADTYAAGIDRLRWIARAALSKETSHDD